MLLIYSFQFRSAFRVTTTPSQSRALDHAQTTPSQPQIRRPYKAPTSVVADNLVKLIVVSITQYKNVIALYVQYESSLKRIGMTC